MSIEYINPPGLQAPMGLSHIVKATGGATYYFSGQGAYDIDGNLVGGNNHYLQAKQAFANVLTALEGIGATFANVVKATYYVVGLNDEVLGDFAKALYKVPGFDPANPPASTMVGVQALGYGEMLIEIDIIAVV